MNGTNEQTATASVAEEKTFESADYNGGAAEGVSDGGAEKAVSLGKFKDVNALLSAYNSLQAEFTKRCQRVKELEAEKAATADKKIPTETAVKDEKPNTGITEEGKEEFIKGYLKEVLGSKSKAIVMDGLGAGVKTPVYKPRTVEEAGRLAKELLAK